MAETVDFPFWSSHAPSEGGEALVAPLLLPEVRWLNASAEALARGFARSVQRGVLNRGDYRKVFEYTGLDALEHRLLPVTFPASEDLLYPALTLSFDLFIAPLAPGGYLGFVPVLGVEAFAETEEQAAHTLKEAIRLAFARQKRLTSARTILSTQWFTQVEVRKTPIQLTFYTPGELRDFEEVRLLVPDVAEPLQVDKPRTFGLEEALDRMIRAVRGRFGRSVLLVGPSGVGKTALVEAFAVAKNDYEDLAGRTLRVTTAARLVQKLTGQVGWQENLSKVCSELRTSGDLLYVRNLADLFEVGQYIGNDVSMAAYLRTYLERGDLTLVTECTDAQAARLEALAPGYLNLFNILRLEAPAEERQLSIIAQRLRATTRERRLQVEEAGIREAFHLQRRYMPYSGFPGKTIRFLETFVRDQPPGEETRTLTRADVIGRFCEESGLPVFMVDPDRAFPLDEIRRRFRANVYGQEAAVEAVVNVLAAVKAGLARSGKPIASLLFAGPTGVGKTELAKVLAALMFGSRDRMIRFDMSEFVDMPSVLRLTGVAGLGVDGLLTGAVRREPFSVVLFDELEKAHPTFFDLLLQILGEGRLTDGRGQVADFCSTILIMTSNIGAREVSRSTLGFSSNDGDRRAEITRHFERAVEGYFRPEFFNRLDRVLAFAPLDRKTVRQIVDREVGHIAARAGLRYRDVRLHVTRPALDLLGEQGYDPVYGARHLQRVLREALVVPLARRLNGYGVDIPLSATVSLSRGEILHAVKGQSGEKVYAGRLRWQLEALAERTTAQRRLLQAVEEGGFFVRLMSTWSMLERDRARQKEHFWKDGERAQRYAVYKQCIEACRTLFEEGGWLETEASLAMLNRQLEARETWAELFIEHLQKSEETLLDLYDTLEPNTRRCVVGLYGPAKRLDLLVSLYRHVARIAGLEATVHGVWRSGGSGKQAYRTRPYDAGAVEENPGTEQETRLLGAEIALEGRGAYPLFSGEAGLHRWRDRSFDRGLTFVVMVQKGAYQGYRRPTEIHRKSFFKGRLRRTIEPKNLDDKTYPLTISRTDVPEALAAALQQRFRDYLLSELTRP